MVSYLKKYILMRRIKSLSPDIQLRFLQRLQRLLNNGYPLLAALEIIKWDKQLINVSTQIIYSLRNGDAIDEAFEIAKFDDTIIAYLYFVRANGDIETSIGKCIDMYEHRIKYLNKLKEMTRYPLILLSIFTLLLFFIKRSVLPSFLELFQSGSEASSTVELSIIIIEFLGILVIAISILAVITFIVWQFNKRKVSIAKQIKLYNYIPIYRNYLSLQTSFLFATHLSTLLKTGMSIKDILENMSKQKKLPIIAYYSSLMTTELSKGLYVENLLSQLTFLEKQLAIIFQKNTDISALEKDLTVYADLLTEELHRKVMKAITFIQPAFFIIIAAFIVFIYLMLMWPMFQLIKTI